MSDLPPDLLSAYDGQPDEAARAARLWDTLGDSPAAGGLLDGVPSTDEALADLERRIARSGSGAASRRAADRDAVPRPGRIVRWASVASVLAACLMVSAWWLQRPVVAEAAPGERVSVALPDGSRVELSGGSEIAYRSGFRAWFFRPDAARRVELRGEAFFAVETAPRPFVVETFSASVTVLGTRFGVRAFADDPGPATRVMLEEGSVRVATRDGAAPVVLRPGEATAVAAGAAPAAPAAVALNQALAWRSGGFAVEDEPLAVVLREIERRYGVEVQAAEGVPLDRPLTFYVGERSVEALLSDIALAAGLRVERLQGGYRFLRDTTQAR
ncbi:MAG: FecR domain-containing protein [Bacteroidota bacterium]